MVTEVGKQDYAGIFFLLPSTLWIIFMALLLLFSLLFLYPNYVLIDRIVNVKLLLVWYCTAPAPVLVLIT